MPRPLASEDEVVFYDQRGYDSFHGLRFTIFVS
jgi:hypothetical protein